MARPFRSLFGNKNGRDRKAAKNRNVIHWWLEPALKTTVAKPQLTDAARPATFEVEAYNEAGEMVPTSIAGEHPLTLYLDKREIVTLMTLGHAPEALAIGYLRNQRLVSSIDEITAVQVDWETGAAAVTSKKNSSKKSEKKMQKRTVTSGCGQGTMFGDLMEE